MIQTFVFHLDGRVESGGEELADRPPPEGGAVWVDFEGEEEGYARRLLDHGYHPLAVEDTFTTEHQPKLEEYDGYLFVIVRGIDFNRSDDQVRTLKLAAFLESQRLVTCHRAPMRSVAGVRRRLIEAGKPPRGSMVHLFYSLADEVIDHYFPVLEDVAEQIEDLEEAIFEDPRPEQLQRILALRRCLTILRRAMLPHRQVFNHLANAQTELVDEAEALYFRDVYDNVFRLADGLDQQRDQLQSAKDTYLSAISQRTNEVMKVLTLFSAVLLPLTFIAGVYGMNFEHMPELTSPYGYFGTLAGMATIAAGMLLWFRRKGWF